ncbi:hypothetical protein OI69_16365 [Pectobacterium fontis]|uniref:Uncharacterized protein n=1 Tax=Pectobacterium fontis TaxID=2558042 RepID=A0A7V8L431_9GAMM|nr:hypothetical protein OI69_16365 [Pectobacterium fontis]
MANYHAGFVFILLFNSFLFVIAVFNIKKAKEGSAVNLASIYHIYNQAIVLMILFFLFNYLIFNGKKI